MYSGYTAKLCSPATYIGVHSGPEVIKMTFPEGRRISDIRSKGPSQDKHSLLACFSRLDEMSYVGESINASNSYGCMDSII